MSGLAHTHRSRWVSCLVAVAITTSMATGLALAESFEYRYDDVGRLVEVTGPDQKLTYTYDAGGNLTGREVVAVPEPAVALLQGVSVLVVAWLSRRGRMRPTGR